MKKEKHPELREETFPERIKVAIQKPTFVYEDLSEKERHAYYIREFKINSRIRYTKVIIRQGKEINFIITAFRPDYVKERDRTSLIYGNDEKE